jgi:hypothetical protein
MVKPKKNSYGEIVFEDHPDFKPNLTPQEMFELGSFGGTYWRPIYSSITGKNYKNQHKKYPKSWWKNIPEDWLVTPWDEYDVSINKYGVKVGTTLEFWEEKGWITEYDPYGWVQWYANFYQGRRTPDDIRQIRRWKGVAGENGRWRNYLITLILRKNLKWNDVSASPKIWQILQHWGYKLNKRDFNKEVKERNKK